MRRFFLSRIPHRSLLAAGAVLLVTSFSLHQVADAATKTATTSVKKQTFSAAVGDSYTSGTGTGTSGGPCDASQDAYPKIAAEAVGSISMNYACAGATLSALNTPHRSKLSMIQSLESLKNLKISYVAMTFGGNDIGALQAIPNLLAGGSVTAFGAKVDALVPKLTTGYKQVRAAIPEADVYVLAYPNILPPTADGYATCKGLSGITIKSPENATLALNNLNAGIKKAVAATKDSKVHYVPVDTFAGHDICSTTPWANGVTGSGALHPNLAGHKEMARILLAATQGKTITTTTAKPATTTTAKPTTTTSKVPVTILATTTSTATPTTSSTVVATTPTTHFDCHTGLIDLASTSKTPDHSTPTCYPAKTTTTVKPTTTTGVSVAALQDVTTSTIAKPTTTTTTTQAVQATTVTTLTTAPASTAPALAYTGSNTMGLLSLAMFLLGLGLAAMWARIVYRERQMA